MPQVSVPQSRYTWVRQQAAELRSAAAAAEQGGLGAHAELEAEGMDAVAEGLEPARKGGAGGELAVHALLGQVAVAARAAVPSAAAVWGGVGGGSGAHSRLTYS